MADFTLDINNFVTKARNNSALVEKKIILEIGRRVVERSPVGDPTYWKSKPPAGYVGGRFRANWQHGTGTMPTAIYDTTNNESEARISASVANSGPHSVHWIVNNLPYSVALENGYSRQAPPGGIVKLTVIEFENIVNEKAREVNR
jgi:hypothetical protein